MTYRWGGSLYIRSCTSALITRSFIPRCRGLLRYMFKHMHENAYIILDWLNCRNAYLLAWARSFAKVKWMTVWATLYVHLTVDLIPLLSILLALNWRERTFLNGHWFIFHSYWLTGESERFRERLFQNSFFSHLFDMWWCRQSKNVS